MPFPSFLRTGAVLLSIVLVPGLLHAQDKDLSEARGHLEQGDPAAAAKSAERSLKQGETSEAHYIIGHNHLVNDALEPATESFRRAIKLDEGNADAVFELGLVLDDQGEHDKAKKQFRRYTELRPDDPKGTIQEAYVLLAQEDRPKEARALVDGVLVRHPDHTAALYYAALSCDALKDRTTAYAHVDRGMEVDPDDVDFPYLKGRWLCREDRYAEAVPVLLKAKELAPEGKYKRYWAWARLMAATDTAHWARVDGDIRLTTTWRNDLDAMDSLARIPGGRYDRAVLMPRFLNDEVLALDELVMLYYGQCLEEGYSPYSDRMDDELREPQREGRWSKVAEMTGAHLKDHPVCLDALSGRANACRNLKEPCYDHATISFELLMQAITSTGSGDSFDDPVLVMSVEDEYTYLGFHGLRMTKQSLHSQGGRSFDVLTCTDADGKERKVHFDITRPFDSLGRSFRKDR